MSAGLQTSALRYCFVGGGQWHEAGVCGVAESQSVYRGPEDLIGASFALPFVTLI